VELVGAIAAVVAAVTGILGLGFAMWWRRPSLEIDFAKPPAIAAEGSSYTVRVDNTGSSTVRVWVALFNGDAIGTEIGPLPVVPPLHRSVTLKLPGFPGRDHDQPRVRVRFGWRRSVVLTHGERKTIYHPVWATVRFR
jgi:hypothetical protein